jgi:hypothetical protein
VQSAGADIRFHGEDEEETDSAQRFSPRDFATFIFSLGSLRFVRRKRKLKDQMA